MSNKGCTTQTLYQKNLKNQNHQIWLMILRIAITSHKLNKGTVITATCDMAAAVGNKVKIQHNIPTTVSKCANKSKYVHNKFSANGKLSRITRTWFCHTVQWPCLGFCLVKSLQLQQTCKHTHTPTLNKKLRFANKIKLCFAQLRHRRRVRKKRTFEI